MMKTAFCVAAIGLSLSGCEFARSHDMNARFNSCMVRTVGRDVSKTTDEMRIKAAETCKEVMQLGLRKERERPPLAAEHSEAP